MSQSDVEIVDDLDEEEEQVPFRYSITSYGADFLVDGIVRRMKDESIVIPAFQRGFVWSMGKSSRFIESLLLGLPVPGIFLSKNPETGQLIVIDGQQRLRSLQFYYDGFFKDPDREFALHGIESNYKNLPYKKLRPEDKRRLDDSILHATIVQQDQPTDDNSSIYLIFERLNTGGLLLRPQEIRACIYHGEFNDLLRELNQNSEWRSVFGKVHTRMRDQELILRFLALYFDGDNYSPPMKVYLNEYMAENRRLESPSAQLFDETFRNTISVAYRSLGENAFKPKKILNAAVYDAVMVGIARRLERGNIVDYGTISQRYQSIIADSFFTSAVESHTADPENIRRRISIATKGFADVK